MVFRALIKTHHMTSRRKIQAIAKSSKANSCSVILKTGKPPGVMIAEGSEDQVRQWVDSVKAGLVLQIEPSQREMPDGVKSSLTNHVVHRG